MSETKLIFGGGNTLPGSPKDWDEARLIQAKLNENNENDIWSFDCNFKLDYDYGILRVSSRFYPPAEYYGPTWDGTVSIMLNEQELIKRKFDCPDIWTLQKEVEEYSKSVEEKIKQSIQNINWEEQ